MARPFKQQVTTPRATIPTPGESDAEQPTQRLHKLLALSGLGSRREMETLIASGRITINGVVAVIGAAVKASDIVRLDSRPLRLQFEAELPKVLLYHKPEGEIVSQDDPENRATVFDKLPYIRGARWVAIGRLDINTSGLLIFTTSGELANKFMHPRYEVEREYAARIFGELSEGQLLQLTQGIELDDGPANFDVIHPLGGEGSNHWYKVILREGRNREVRRLFEAFQLPVSRLMRVRFGPINLPPRLKRGQMLELEAKEVIGLLEWAELEVPRTPPRQLSAREKEKAGKAFTPKAAKEVRGRAGADEIISPGRTSNAARSAQAERPPSLAETLTGTERKSRTRPLAGKPKKTGTQKRRVRHSADLQAAPAKKTSKQG